MATYNPYYPQNYQQPYYPQVAYPQTTQPVQPVQPVAAQPTNNGLIWVQGEAGAKSYLVAPNTTVMLMDSESERFFLKSADASGMPLPLRVFDYTEATKDGKADINIIETKQDYITREEFDNFRKEMTRKEKSKKKDDDDDE